jgi:hypothetical protein
MPTPISALQKGLKFESTSGRGTSPNLKLENLTLSSSGSVFMPDGASTSDLLNATAGGVLITVNPDNQTTAKSVTLIEGKFLDISLEFDGLGQFRFKVSPGVDQPTVSAWLPERTEHTIAVGYNSTSNILTVSVDGTSTQTSTDFSGFESTANLKVANPGNGSAAAAGTYDGFIGQLALFRSEPSMVQLDRMSSNPDSLRADYASIDLPTLSAVQGVNSRGEIQKITVTGSATASASITALGATVALASGDNPTQVATKIAAEILAIKAANPTTIDTVTASGADLTITYLLSAGDVVQAASVGPANGITLSAAAEVSKPVTVTSETQTVAVSGTATTADAVQYLGVASAPVAAGAAASNVVTAILTNKAAILAGAAAKAAKIIDLSSTTSGVLTLTFSPDAGDVANATAITAASNGITFGVGTEVVKGATGIAEAHTITLGGSYKAGDRISINSVDTSPAPVTKTYTVLSGDIKSTAAATQAAIAASMVTAFASQVGVYSVASSTNTLVLTGANSAGNLPDPTLTFTTASGLIENGLQDYFDFTKIALLTSSVTGAGGGVATFNSEASATAVIPVVSQDYSGSTVVAPPTTGPTTVLPVNGPIYARLKSYTKDSGTNVPKFTYELFVNKAAGLTTLSSLGFTLDFDETRANFISFVPGSGGTLQDVNSLQANSQGKVTYQWAATTGVTDFSLPVAELTLSLKGTAPFNANTAVSSIGMELSNMSVNSTFFTQTGTTLPLVISAPLDAERYSATGVVQQVFTNTTPSSPQTSYAQAGTVVGYEVFGAQTNPAVRLDIKDTYAATKTSAPNASVQLDIIANSLPTVGSKFSMVVNLPSNATGATLTAAPGVTLIPAASVLSGTQFRVEGTYVAPAGVTTTTPTLGTIAMTLVREHNTGSDFSISDLTFNGATAVGRSLYFGLAESNSSGALNMLNLPKGEMVMKVFDNPLALTSAASLSSFITIEDARAVMTIASGKNNGALNASTPGTPWSPSDYIAADWDKNGAVSAADALAMLNYILATDKSTTTLDYIYIDQAANTLAKSPMSVSSVVVPPIAKVNTHKDLSTDYTFADGHNDINIVGILVGDLVK